MRLKLLAIILVCAAPAHAEMTQQQARCRLLADPSAAVTKSVGALTAHTENSMIETQTKILEGAPLEAAKRVDAARAEVAPKLKAYLNALQDFDYALKVCAR